MVVKSRVQRFEFRVSSLLCGLLLFVSSVLAELTVSLKPETESRFVYEPFTLLLTINSEADPNLPQIPSSGGFVVAGISPIPDTHNFRIEIVPELEGMLTLPPIEIRAGKETVQTLPLRLSVDAPHRATEMDLRAELSSTNLYVDQPVTMTVTWKSTSPFTRCQDLLLDIPLLRNSQWDVYPLDPGVPEKERIGLPVNNERVIARLAKGELRFSFMLIARRAGATPPSEIRLNCTLMENKRASSQYPSYFDNHFFNRPDVFAGLDVYETEPLPRDSPLLRLDNAICYPHSVGGGGDDMYRLASAFAGDNIRRFCDGQPLKAQIRPAAYDRMT